MGESEVAEVVAVVRAEDRDFKKGMEEAHKTVDQTGDRVEQSQKKAQRSIDLTTLGLGKLRLGYLGAAAAAGGFISLLERSPVAQAQNQITGIELNRIGTQLYKGLQLKDAQKALNRGLKGTADYLAGDNRVGDNNLFVGDMARKMLEAPLRRQSTEDQYRSQSTGGIGNRLRSGGLGILDEVGGFIQSFFGGGEENIPAGIGRLKGAITNDPGQNSAEDIAKTIPTQYLVKLEVELKDNPELVRLLQEELERRMKQNLGGTTG